MLTIEKLADQICFNAIRTIEPGLSFEEFAEELNKKYLATIRGELPAIQLELENLWDRLDKQVYYSCYNS